MPNVNIKPIFGTFYLYIALVIDTILEQIVNFVLKREVCKALQILLRNK